MAEPARKEPKLLYSEKIHPEHRRIINRAIRRNKRGLQHYVVMKYKKENGDVEEKIVRPHTTIRSKAGNDLVVGYAKGVGLRSFRTDRVEHLKEASMQNFWAGFEKQANITAAKRHSLPPSEFAEPQREAYPVDTKARARNAKARVAQFGTPAEVAAVDRKVHEKYPDIGEK